MNYKKFQKWLVSGQARNKYKKQCLKNKNIVFESEQIQIGCKVNNIYDFYSSSNYLQLNIFIGNKTDRPIDNFHLDFKATSNVELFTEEKLRSIKERTQYKERVIVNCKNYQEEVLILIEFQSTMVTLKSNPLPITLHHFCMPSQAETIPPSILTQVDLQKFLEHKYEYTEQSQFRINQSLFKKGFQNELQKYFPHLIKLCEGVYLLVFTMRNLSDEYTMVFKCSQSNLKLSLSSDEYGVFDSLFSNYKFLLE